MPADTSEMVSQLLFGHHFLVAEQHENWVRVKTQPDSYEGWVDQKQVLFLSEGDYSELNQKPPVFVASTDGVLTRVDHAVQRPIPKGSILPHFQHDKLKIGDEVWHFEGIACKPCQHASSAQLIADARDYLFAPYLWGGRSPWGIDCSGFTQMVYLMNGIPIPRDASQQALKGEAVSPNDAQPGDLAFFTKKDKERVTHVGMLIDPDHIIHASGEVRIDQLDSMGIVHSTSKQHTHQLHSIRRFL